MHILLVEPDPILARTYEAALEAVGHNVVATRSAQTAVHAADEHMPELVVLELQLPFHNGVEFLYEFRSYSEWLHIPIVIHSFAPPHEYAHASTLSNELGVVRFLHKPATSLQKLVAVVAHYAPHEQHSQRSSVPTP